MLQEVIDLQKRAVSELIAKYHGRNNVLTFRAPTGSGKTFMMADFMNQILDEDDNIIFLVSTLSKGNLARQNYDSFQNLSDNKTFPNLKPHLISTDISGEETLYIPTDHNVYVLPRDLYKDKGKLMQGPMVNFLLTITENYFGNGLGKKIILIKDECHQATNNLDSLSEKFFAKVINFSATPNLKRGQNPDVQISDEEAVNAKLIKKVKFESDNDTIEDAIIKFEDIKKKYLALGVNPCLIIQISNKDKAEEEWKNKIKPVLDKVEHQGLKWMVIVDQKDKKKTASLCDTNDIVKKKLPVDKWKDYAKQSTSNIDIIVFKMVISEGWDIPRACMLYQVRDTKSKQLDEQVMGRVRRNPRLMDFDTLTDDDIKRLATTAWVWGIPPENMRRNTDVRLKGDGSAIQSHIRVKTTRLTNITQKADFNIDAFIQSQKKAVVHGNIFDLHRKLSSCPNDLQTLCYKYAGDDIAKWWLFMDNFDKIKAQYDTFICDYNQSMVVGEETSFPTTSSYIETDHNNEMEDWVWCKKSGDDTFSFDSEAERKWASLLQKISRKNGEEITIEGEEDDINLWGKNFPLNSNIRYEYYANGIHSSYPDFIMKDNRGHIHVFEVKSVNIAKGSGINTEEYQEKISRLEKCYAACSSKLAGYYFYLPVLEGSDWKITRFHDGERDVINAEQFKSSFKK